MTRLDSTSKKIDHIDVLVGTRPEIIKQAPIISQLRDRDIEYRIIHTKQHYDTELSDLFFEEFDLPSPDVSLDVGSGTHGEQTGNMLAQLQPYLAHESRDSMLLVQGDTNSALVGALCSMKLPNVILGHVEAGLRSYDYRMPEEYNRRVIDHVSDILYAPTKKSKSVLKSEEVPGRAHVTGNTVIDAVERLLPVAEKQSDNIPTNSFVLATAHRAENVDDRETLTEIITLCKTVTEDVILPLHPRTEKSLQRFDLYEELANTESVNIRDPVGYLDFLALMSSAEYIITDSGGIQEEVTAPSLNKRVFVFREQTERPEAVESGHATVVGTDAEEALALIDESSLNSEKQFPFGKGNAAIRIVDLIENNLL